MVNRLMVLICKQGVSGTIKGDICDEIILFLDYSGGYMNLHM